MTTSRKYISIQERAAYSCLEDVVGCKWSASIVAALDEGVHRPGELERFIPGISKKMLSERLRKLADFLLITRHETPAKITRVEYRLTNRGKKLARIIAQLRKLQE